MKGERRNSSGELKSYAIDTGVLMHHYFKKDLDEILKRSLVNEVTISEVLYVLCRVEGLRNALNFISDIAGKIIVPSSNSTALVAGQFKCKYPIALADCWVLATAKVNGVPALFESREEEIVKRLSKIEQEVEIEFLDELVN
jgi:predicted nucleic acid-binding protein